MHIETYGPHRARLVLQDANLELWLFLDAGHPPKAFWCDSRSGKALAEVPVVSDAAPRSGHESDEATPRH